MTDWAHAAAKALATIARKHGLRCRVVVCKHTDSYTVIYRDSEDGCFDEKHKATLAEAKAAGWDGFSVVVRT